MAADGPQAIPHRATIIMVFTTNGRSADRRAGTGHRAYERFAAFHHPPAVSIGPVPMDGPQAIPHRATIIMVFTTNGRSADRHAGTGRGAYDRFAALHHPPAVSTGPVPMDGSQAIPHCAKSIVVVTTNGRSADRHAGTGHRAYDRL